MKKYILVFVFIIASLFFSSCNGENDVESSITSDEISVDESSKEESQTVVSSEEAFEMLSALLEKDSENVRLFFENGFYEHTRKTSSVMPINEDSEYSKYSNVLKLFEIYASPTSEMEYFLNYPVYGPKAIYEKDGVVYSAKIDSKKLEYPKTSEFVICELAVNSATFSFETPEGEKKIILDYKSNTLSESPYRLMYSSNHADKWNKVEVPESALNCGSAKQLLGKTLIINVFLIDKKTDWEDSEVISVLEKINSATSWLNKIASEKGIDFSLSSTTKTTSLYYRSSSTLTTEADDQIWINEMFAYTTYGSIDDYIKSNCKVENYDNYLVMFHINQEGENNIGRFEKEMFENTLYKTERAVMYSKNSISKDYLFAMLSLFGAESLESVKDEAKTYFGDDIMLKNTSLNSTAVLGDITEYLIGWKTSLHPQLSNMINKIYEQN